MVKPISPNEVTARRKEIIPEFVLKAWNEAIVQAWDGSRAVIYQENIITHLLSYSYNEYEQVTRQDIFDKHYLDIEDIYENAGWNVEYDKPAYNESYSAKFTFTKKGT